MNPSTRNPNGFSGPRRPALLLVALLLGTATLRAAAFYVEPARGDADEPWLMETLHGSVSDAVSESGDTVASSPEPDAYELRPMLLRRDGSLVVILELRSTGPGRRKLVLSGRLTAPTASSLGAVAGKLTRSLVEEGTGNDSGAPEAAQNGTPDLAQGGGQDSSPDGGIPIRFSFNLGLGPRALMNLDVPTGASAETYGLDLGFKWPVADRVALTLDSDYAWTESGLNSTGTDSAAAWMESMTLGWDYYLGLGPTAPYVGAGLGYGWYAAGTLPPGFGYCADARVGVEFFRDRTVRLGLELRWSVVLSPDWIGLPSCLGATVGLHF